MVSLLFLPREFMMAFTTCSTVSLDDARTAIRFLLPLMELSCCRCLHFNTAAWISGSKEPLVRPSRSDARIINFFFKEDLVDLVDLEMMDPWLDPFRVSYCLFIRLTLSCSSSTPSEETVFSGIGRAERRFISKRVDNASAMKTNATLGSGVCNATC